MAKDKSKSENDPKASRKKLLENVLSKINVPSTSKSSMSSSEEESSEEEDVSTKTAQPQLVRNNTFQSNKQLQMANLNNSKTIASNKGILKKPKKLETISDSESDQNSSKSVFPPTKLSNSNERDSDGNWSDENFSQNPLAISTQKEPPENEVRESTERQNLSKSKSKKIKIIEDIHIKPASSFTKDETIEDDETETDIVLSSLKCLYPDEHFTKVTDKCTLKDNIGDKKVFLIHVPKTLDPNLLVGCTISTKKDTKLNVNGEEVVFQLSKDVTRPLSTIVKLKNHQFACKTLKPVGNILVHHELKSGDKAEPLTVVNNTIEFPKDLKTRHPLFGVDYSDKINIDEGTQQKMNKTVNDHSKKKKKKKSKEVRKIEDEDDEMVFKLLGDNTNSKNLLNNDDQTENSFGLKTPTKVMHSTMLSSLENTPVFNPNENQSAAADSVPKKKKKHKKKDHQELIMNILEKYTTNNNEVESTSKRKHKQDDDLVKREKKKKKKKVDTSDNS